MKEKDSNFELKKINDTNETSWISHGRDGSFRSFLILPSSSYLHQNPSADVDVFLVELKKAERRMHL